jgi:Ca2+-binding RTX toxin-like protein
MQENIDAGAGDDVLRGGPNTDFLNGNTGTDDCDGESGADVVRRGIRAG